MAGADGDGQGVTAGLVDELLDLLGVQGITEAAKEVSAPLILQVSKGARAYANHTRGMGRILLMVKLCLFYHSFPELQQGSTKKVPPI